MTYNLGPPDRLVSAGRQVVEQLVALTGA